MDEQLEVSTQNTDATTEQPMGILERTIGVFTAPQKTFEDIAKFPSWVFPFILMVIATMLITQLLVPVILADQQSNERYLEMMQDPNMSPEQLERMQDISEKSVKNFAAIGGGVTVIITSILSSAIILFIGNIILGGEAKFLQIFSMFCWGGLIGTLGYLIRLPLSLSKMTMDIAMGPAIIFPAGSEEQILYKLASAMDIFILWRMAMIAIGFAAIYRISQAKSYATIGGMYALMVLAGIVLSTVF